MSLRHVTKQEFYALIGPRDIAMRNLTKWPYTSEWFDQRTRVVVGRSVKTDRFELREHNTCGHKTDYYIDDDALSGVQEIK